MESLSLNFLKIMVTPTPLDKSGQIKKGDVVTYDLLAMKRELRRLDHQRPQSQVDRCLRGTGEPSVPSPTYC